MTLEEAQCLIRNDKAGFAELAHAAVEIASSSDSTFQDLLICLKRNGYTAEIAATALYVRTKRPQIPPDITGVVLDYDDWRNYLFEKKLIAK